MRSFRKHQSLKRGFTLTELLVVIMVMVVLMGIGTLSVTKNNNAQGLETGLATLESLIHQARSTAMGSGKDVRLCINNKSGDDNYRREAVIVVNNGTDTAPSWEVESRPVILPQGVFVDSSLSVSGLTGLAGFTTATVPFNKKDTFSALCLNFNHLGICKPFNSTALPTGAVVGVVDGVITGASNIQMQNEKKAALVVWRNGTTSKVNDIKKIQ